MNLLVLNYEYPPIGGGGGPVCQELCEHYVRRGHHVEVVTMGFRGLPRHEVRAGVEIDRVPALRRRPDLCETHEMASYVASALPRVAARLRRGRYDAIHTHFVVPTGLLAWLATRFRKTPTLITAHGSDIPGFNPDRFQGEHRFTRPLLRMILRGTARITSPSLYLAELIQQACGPFPVRHIPNGIDVLRLSPGVKQRRIVMTGRLLRRKGFQHVLEALRDADGDFEVHLAGDGPMRGELEALAAQLKARVVFHGWLDHDSAELRELYESGSIFCLPSESENASVALLEAMLSGMAVVTSNTTGCAETVGDTGFVVSPGDTDALRRVLLDLLGSDERRSAAGQAGRTRVLEQFNWEHIGDRYLAELAQITASEAL